MPHITKIIFTSLIACNISFANAQDQDQKLTLKGPTVSTQTQNSIGSTDMSGRFTPVESRPELAAFMLVTNDQNNLAAARDLDYKRTLALTIFLVDEIDTVRAITDAIAQGNSTQAQILLATLRKRFEPTLPRDPFIKQLDTMLDATQRTEFHRILDEYWHNWIQAQRPETTIKPNSRAAKKIENTLNHKLFEQDIQLAYDISLKRYRDTIDAIATATQPTADQQAQIRTLIIDHIKATRLKATIGQREELMLEIYTLFDEPRKRKLFRLMTTLAISGS